MTLANPPGERLSDPARGRSALEAAKVKVRELFGELFEDD
jgi:hypothetical protein